VGLAVPNVFAEDTDNLGIRVGLELVASLVEDELQLFVWRMGQR
jgi:hypothetical protein